MPLSRPKALLALLGGILAAGLYAGLSGRLSAGLGSPPRGAPRAPGPAFAEGSPPARPNARSPEDPWARHVRVLEKRLPGPGFTIVVEKPFVVIGDEAPAMVRRRAKHTVRWAVDLLKDAFFDRDPLHILDIWLFRDRKSYEANAVKLFGSRPTTPYGYYSSAHRALVMNIATGGGTLVHEIVHPFMEANFPHCPPWFNEGLGSLYEQCRERHGEIRGLTNWRLEGLQKAIRAGNLPDLRALTAMDTSRFYGPGSGIHYACARYLLYHLQEKGLLRRYYRRFLARREEDPTGFETLREILDVSDMTAFEKRLRAWFLTLRYP